MSIGQINPWSSLGAFASELPVHGLGAALVILILSLGYLVWDRRTVARKSREFERISRRYASTIDVSLDAIVVTDSYGKILDFNTAAERLFGLSRNVALGAMMPQVIIPEKYREAHNAGMRRIRTSGEAHVVNRGRITLEGLHSSGEVFPIEISIGMTDGPDGPIFTGYIRDISDQLKAQQEITLARDEALAAVNAKSQFLAVMSHEMRTPLNGVLAVLDILSSSELDGKQRRFVEAAINSGELLQRHIDDLLQLNELENRRLTFRRTTFSIGEMIKDVVAMNAAPAAARGNRIFLETELGDLFIVEDRHRISQVLVNLVSNAVKFTQDGRIEISVDRIRGEDGGEMIEFVVHDNGLGIPVEDQERIFENFVTLDPSYRQATRGYGLGLAICRRIVRAMDGDIGVQSRPGQYSRFWVRLPLREASASASGKSFKSSTARPFELPQGTMGLHVLIVEDDETNRLVASEMLSRFGCSVVEAVDGLEALKKASTDRFDMILMDVNMPNMDGMEATRRLRDCHSGLNFKTPIVGMTAHALPEEQERLLDAGMQECLIKPVRARNIQALLRRMAEFPGEFAGDTGEGAPAGPGQPYIDRGVTAELRELLTPPAFSVRVKAFQDELVDLSKRLQTAIETGGPSSVEQTAHKIAGAAAVFGAARLRDHLVEIEQTARRGDSRRLRVLLEETDRVAAGTVEAFGALASI